MASNKVEKKPSFRRPNYKTQEIIVDVLADNDQFIPEYHSDEAACCDLVANIVDGPTDAAGKKCVIIPSRNIVAIDCGFSMAIPAGFKAEIQVRSGHAKKGMVVINSPAQIDSDYRGRLMVLIGNIGKEIIKIEHGERFAQLSLAPVYRFKWHKTSELPQTKRGTGALGSTGAK